jgi:hypothetical protein
MTIIKKHVKFGLKILISSLIFIILSRVTNKLR